MSEKDIYSRLKINPSDPSNNPISQASELPLVRLQKQIISLLLYKPENHDILILEQHLFTQPKLRDIFIKLREYCLKKPHQRLALTDCRKILPDAEYKLLEDLSFSTLYQMDQLNPSDDQIQNTIEESIRLLKSQYKSLARKTLMKKLKEAKKIGDYDKVQEILKKYQSLT
jgi:hypothetical protein